MNDRIEHGPDLEPFGEILRNAATPLADEAFVDGVMRRVRRRVWIRRGVLCGAVALGLVIAAPALLDFAAQAGALARAIEQRPAATAWFGAYYPEITFAAIALLWPALVRWLTR